MRKMFGHHKNDGVISGNFLVSNGNGIPTVNHESPPKEVKQQVAIGKEPIPCDNKRFQKLSSRLKQLKIVVSVTQNSHGASFYTVE